MVEFHGMPNGIERTNCINDLTLETDLLERMVFCGRPSFAARFSVFLWSTLCLVFGLIGFCFFHAGCASNNLSGESVDPTRTAIDHSGLSAFNHMAGDFRLHTRDGFVQRRQQTAVPEVGFSQEGLLEHGSLPHALPPVSVFYAIDSPDQPYAWGFRSTARMTWLRSARDLGQTYRFFMHYPENKSRALALEMEAREMGDIVLAKRSEMWWNIRSWNPSEKKAKARRGGSLVRYALEWALRNTDSQYIVKSDIDGFVCPMHLLCVLMRLRLRYKDDLFYSLSWNSAGRDCHADQNFMTFDAVSLKAALRTLNSSDWRDGNFIDNYGDYLRRSWAQGKASVFDDRVRIAATPSKKANAKVAVKR